MTFLRQVTDAVATAVDPTIEARSRWPTEQKHPSANRAVAVAQTCEELLAIETAV